MSASTNSRCLCRTTPSWGRVVVKAYSPTLACALVTALMKVDLPALGSPTSPASASSLSRSHTHASSYGQPVPCWRGARLVDVLRSEEHTSELQSLMRHLVCRLLLEKKKKKERNHKYQSIHFGTKYYIRI